MAAELRADRSTVKLAEAITLYHVVVEASLAQPGQHMIERYLEEFDVLPGFREGMRNVALDEQRHIGFGVEPFADLYAEDPGRIGEVIVGVLREVLPWTAAVAAPPGWDETYTTAWGFTLDDLGEAGAASMEQKLRAIGLPVDDLPRFPLPMDLPPRERAVRGRRLLRANLIGAGEQPVVKDPEAVAILFDQMRRQADAAAVPPGTTIEWAFTDFEPLHLTLRRAARSPPPGAPRTPTSCCAPRSRAGPTSPPAAPTRCGSSSPVACGPKATCASCRASGASSGRRRRHATAARTRGDVALRTCATALYRGLQMNPGPDDVQPVEHETRDRIITGTVTVLPFLALFVVAWQVWSSALGWSDLVVFGIVYAIAGLGVTVGFHRLFTHRSFKTAAAGAPRWPSPARWRSRARSPPGWPTIASTTRSPTSPATRTPRTSTTAAGSGGRCGGCCTRTSAGSSCTRSAARRTAMRPTCERPRHGVGRPHVRLWVTVGLMLPSGSAG